MNLRGYILTSLVFLAAGICPAATHYVVQTNSLAADPYTNWAKAGTNIIDVVNAAMTNTEDRMVWVSNGIYLLTNQVYLTNSITVRSVNGKGATFIDGHYPEYTNRCFLIASNAVVLGFTISNGHAMLAEHPEHLYDGGGGVYIRASGQLRDSRVCQNFAKIVTKTLYGGGGVQIYGAGGVVSNCDIEQNTVTNDQGGGGVALYNGLLVDSRVKQNTGTNCSYGGYGCKIYNGTVLRTSMVSNGFITCNAGAKVLDSTIEQGDCSSGMGCGMVSNCVFHNIASALNYTCIYGYWDGGYASESPLTIVNCTLISNLVSGIVVYPQNSKIRNCRIALGKVSTSIASGISIYAHGSGSEIENCTVVFNTNSSSWWAGGGIRFHAGTTNVTVRNCIVQYNYGAAGSVPTNFTCDSLTNAVSYSCIGGTNSLGENSKGGNITNDPSFSDASYRLSAQSPCVNSGINQNWMFNGIDLDGNRRLDQLNGRVDMGAYEFIHTITLISGH